MDDFTAQWATEINVDELPIYDDAIVLPKSIEIKVHVNYGVQDILDALKAEKLELNAHDTLPRIMSIKAKSIEQTARYLYNLGKHITLSDTWNITPFKIMYKDLYPGDTMIKYDMWIEFI